MCERERRGGDEAGKGQTVCEGMGVRAKRKEKERGERKRIAASFMFFWC